VRATKGARKAIEARMFDDIKGLRIEILKDESTGSSTVDG